MLGLRQWQLMLTSGELVPTVLEPIRPRDEHLATPARGHLVDAVAVDDVRAVDCVRPQPSAHLDDHHALVVERDLELLARGRKHAYPGWMRVVEGFDSRLATTKDRRPIATATIAVTA